MVDVFVAGGGLIFWQHVATRVPVFLVQPVLSGTALCVRANGVIAAA